MFAAVYFPHTCTSACLSESPRSDDSIPQRCTIARREAAARDRAEYFHCKFHHPQQRVPADELHGSLPLAPQTLMTAEEHTQHPHTAFELHSTVYNTRMGCQEMTVRDR